MVNQLSGFGAGGGTPFIETLRSLSLTTNLVLCLDAGDSSSYGGTGQDWVDVSGFTEQSAEFHRGTANTAGTDDPTFNGAAGSASNAEYFSSDGDDFFEWGGTREAWMGDASDSGLHHDNATFTSCLWVYIPAGSTYRFWDTGNMSNQKGIGFTNNGSNVQIYGHTGAASNIIDQTSSVTYNDDSWNFVAVSLDEAGGGSGSVFHVNGDSNTFDGTYNTTTGQSQNLMHIGATGTGGNPMPNGARIGGVMFWDTNLSNSDMLRIYNATKTRYGL